MGSDKVSRPLIAEKHGLLIAIGLIILFFIMRALDLAHVVELRVLNFFVMLAGILMAIKTFRKKNPEDFTYFRGMGLGILTGVIGTVIFALFIFFYVNNIDPDFLQAIKENQPFGRFLNSYMVAIILAIEGIASALLISFIIINYLDPTKLE